MKRSSLLASLLIALLPVLAAGQVLEQPVPFDSSGAVIEWTPKIENQARLFPDVDGFQKALLWKADTSYQLEIITRQGRMRRELSPAGYDSLKRRIAGFFQGQGRDLLINQEGRGTLLWGQLPLSLVWYGPAVVALVDPDNGSTATGLYMLSASASYYIPLALTSKAQITKAQAGLTLNYGYLGLPVGWAIPAIFDCDEYKPYMAAMLATSIAGQVSGFHLAKTLTEPQGGILAAYTFFGAAQGTLLSLTLQHDPNQQATALGTLAGTGLGCAAGLLTCRRPGLSDGEPDIISTSGVCGGLIGLHAALLLADLDGDTHQPFTGAALAGSAAGLWLGHKLTEGYSFTNGDGYIVAGATAGGYLLGAGFGYLLIGSSHDDRSITRTLAGTSLAGLAGGYAVGLLVVRKLVNRAEKTSSLEIGINPVGLASLAMDLTAGQRIPLVWGRF